MPSFSDTIQPLNLSAPTVRPVFSQPAKDNVTPDYTPYTERLEALSTAPQQDDLKLVQTIGNYAVAAPVEIADSIGALLPGVEKGEIHDSFWEGLGMNSFARWRRDNAEGVEVVGGIAGAVAIGYAAEVAVARAVTSGWLQATAIGARVQPLVQMTSRAQEAARRATLVSAEEGVALSAFSGANGAYIAAQTGEFIARAAVGELAIVAALQKNDAIWSDNMSQNLLYAATGMGIGGIVGTAIGRFNVYSYANSTEVIAANLQRFDPAGYRQLQESAAAGLNGLSGTTLPKNTTQATVHWLNASRLSDGADDATRASTISLEFEQAKRALQRSTGRGQPGQRGTGFNVVGTNEGSTLLAAMKADPTVTLGAASISKLDDAGVAASQAFRADYIAGLKLSRNQKDQALALVLDRQVGLALMNGRLMDLESVAQLNRFEPGQARPKFSTNTGQLEAVWDSDNIIGLQLGANGTLNRDIAKLDIHQLLEVTEVADQMMSRMLTGKLTLTLPKNPTWFQLDYASEFLSRKGRVDFTKHAKIASEEELAINSLRSKHTALGNTKELGPIERLRLNLPEQTPFERVTDPEGKALRALLKGADQPGVTLESLKEAREQLAKAMGLLEKHEVNPALDGGLFNYNRLDPANAAGKKNVWARPVLMYFDDKVTNTWTHMDLVDSLAFHKGQQISTMEGGTPFVAALTKLYKEGGYLSDVLDVTGMSNNMLAGTQNRASAVTGQILSADFRFRNVRQLAAANAMRQQTNHGIEAARDASMAALNPYLEKLNQQSAAKSKALVNQFYSQGSPWNIERAVDAGDGLYHFKLSEGSSVNRQLLGRELTDADVAMKADGSGPLAVDADGLNFINAAGEVMDGIRKEHNTIRLASGYDPIPFKAYYVPPASTEGKRVGFTLDANNRPVPFGGVVADSQAEFERLRKQVMDGFEAQGRKGYRFVSKQDVEIHSDVWDQIGMDFIDPTTLAANRGSSKGVLASSRTNPQALNHVVDYVNKGHQQVANGVVRNILDSQLKNAQMADAALRSAHKQGTKVKSIFQIYRDTLLGIPSSADSGGISGIASKLDAAMDRGLAGMSPGVNATKRHFISLFNMAGKDLPAPTGAGGAYSYAALADSLGNATPFSSLADMMTYERGLDTPWKSKEMAMHFNRFASGIILRWLELPHAMMNIAGLIVNTPAIVTAADAPRLGTIAGAGVVDTAKIISRGMRRFMNRRGNADWDYALRHGFASQPVAELNYTLDLLDASPSRARKLFTGDSAAHGYTKYEKVDARYWKGLLRHKGIEGMASILTDSSEDFSRQMAHFIGLEMADQAGITGMAARQRYAHQIANKAIANYDPLNRPEIYQSAFGSMYGLFLTYAQNYYQRLFRWMEQGDFAAVGKNLGMQAALFGFTGLPGTRQIADLLGGEEDGTTILDGIYSRFGPAVGSVVAHGGFNQLTTLLGLPPMAIHTRGDVNFRHPSSVLFTAGKLPTPVGLEVAGDLINGVFEVMNKTIDPKVPMSGRHAAEIIARNMPSRVMRGVITMAALGGQEADVFGNLMAETRSEAEGLFRVLGVRSQRQQVEMEAYFQNQKAMSIDGERMDRLRQATRALVRSGDMDRLPEVFQGYLDSGGKPWNFHNWIEQLAREATGTRAQNQLLRTMKSRGMQMLARRISLYSGEQL